MASKSSLLIPRLALVLDKVGENSRQELDARGCHDI